MCIGRDPGTCSPAHIRHAITAAHASCGLSQLARLQTKRLVSSSQKNWGSLPSISRAAESARSTVTAPVTMEMTSPPPSSGGGGGSGARPPEPAAFGQYEMGRSRSFRGTTTEQLPAFADGMQQQVQHEQTWRKQCNAGDPGAYNPWYWEDFFRIFGARPQHALHPSCTHQCAPCT